MFICLFRKAQQEMLRKIEAETERKLKEQQRQHDAQIKEQQRVARQEQQELKVNIPLSKTYTRVVFSVSWRAL